MQQKIVLVGGPGTGKTSVIKELSKRGFSCMNEVSREVTLKAKEQGIEQLFLEDPFLFSEHLLQGRIKQFKAASELNASVVFFDRGIPDVEAYLQFSKLESPAIFSEASAYYRYSKIFYFQPWEEIYQTDNERYESYEQAKEIDQCLKKIYAKYGYTLLDIPLTTVKQRADFILNSLK